MGIKVLCIGEIVSKAGVYCIKQVLPQLKKDRHIDFVVANGEGTTGGFGIGKNHSIYLRKLGIDMITGGEKIFFKKDMVEHIKRAPYIIRPANYPPGTPGRGWKIVTVKDKRIAVLSLLGQSGYSRVHLSNPFTYLPELVTRLKDEADIVLVDFHATTTAEKQTMFHMADGTVAAVIGTHAKALSADARIMPQGTGVICDTGRTGSLHSVGGLDPAIELEKFLTQIPERSREAWLRPELQGVLLDINDEGKTEAIETLRIPCKEAPHEGNGNSHEDRK